MPPRVRIAEQNVASADEDHGHIVRARLDAIDGVFQPGS